MESTAKSAPRQSGLKDERDRFVAFAFAGAHLLVEIDKDGVVAFASGTSCGLAGGDVDQLVGRNFYDFVLAEDQPFLHELFTRLGINGRIEPTWVRLRSSGGNTIYALIGGSYLVEKPGNYFLAITVPAQIQHKEPRVDDTGLLDEEDFAAVAKERMQAASRMGFDHSLTFFVLDSLAELGKQVDTGIKNEVLDELSAVLRANSVGGDSAGVMEGGKFGVVHDANVDIDELRDRIAGILEKHRGDNRAEPVRKFTMELDTAGLSEVDATKALIYSIRKFAEQGADLEIDSLESGAQSLLDDTAARVSRVRNVIDNQDLELVFQPIIGLFREDVHHFEALTRLTGVSSPAQFIAFTEEVGMIEDFDLTVCGKVVENLLEHAETGFHPCIAVNLSARSLNSDLFVRQLHECIKPLGRASDQLMFELTETHVVDDMQRMGRILQDFRSKGHAISLDDMGSGNTALSMLRQLQIDYAKLDGQLIRDAVEDDRTMALLKSIIELARGLGTQLIAEQIETESQARMMHKLGVEFGQGYLYGRPVPDCQTEIKKRDPEKINVKRKGAQTTWG
ncbi:MAG: EAL domain-containing protein [Alphaproteobacteria bacterium]|jgi:EAL domain-containing protein (putative c-di-GMP-specific phosphodiesterase class I)/GGDEF domain-containing protein|nr:EAL domain-containing protein [Alphaproteobacteria bacterium]